MYHEDDNYQYSDDYGNTIDKNSRVDKGKRNEVLISGDEMRALVFALMQFRQEIQKIDFMYKHQHCHKQVMVGQNKDGTQWSYRVMTDTYPDWFLIERDHYLRPIAAKLVLPHGHIIEIDPFSDGGGFGSLEIRDSEGNGVPPDLLPIKYDRYNRCIRKVMNVLPWVLGIPFVGLVAVGIYYSL